jgi:sugar phosphate isomerase/epimerase
MPYLIAEQKTVLTMDDIAYIKRPNLNPMDTETTRRLFLRNLGLAAAGATIVPAWLASCTSKTENSSGMFFKISLAEWSLHKALFAHEFTNLDFPMIAKRDYGIDAVEYVTVFFKDKAQDQAYLADLKQRCDDHGVTSLLIMCDGEGYLGDLDEARRNEAVDNHKKWVEAAKFLGCHSIRVNAFGVGEREAVAAAATDGLRSLSTFAKDFNINVIVENHGSYSSDGQWLSSVIKNTGMGNCGTLPDFGNFCIERAEGSGDCIKSYDRYKGVEEMMPFAKGVSAKSYDFDEQGNCIETDYVKMLSIVKDSGYTGHIGIEYEGGKLSEPDGIKATKALLERIGASI